MTYEIQPYALFLLVKKLKHIMTLKDFKQLVMMTIFPILNNIEKTEFDKKWNHHSLGNINQKHFPIRRLVVDIAYQEKVRYELRLYITMRYSTPTALDIWKQLDKKKAEVDADRKRVDSLHLDSLSLD